MPILTLYGLPDTNRGGFFKDELQYIHLMEQLRAATANLSVLQVSGDDVSVFMPKDHVQKGLGEELILFVVMMEKPDRTPEVKRSLAAMLSGVLANFARATGLRPCKIEVFVRTADLSDGSWAETV